MVTEETNLSSLKTIKCVNFEINESSIHFKRLFSYLVYSPSSRFAVHISREQQLVTSIFILDPFNMQFHQYRNSSQQDLKMNMFYWYSEDCLIFIHADRNTLYQTPVVLNHQQKTYEAKEPVTHVTQSRILFKKGLTANCIELAGKKYVLLPCNATRLCYIYAISHKPDALLPLKKYLFPNMVSIGSSIPEKIEAENGDRNINFYLSMQVFVINNHAFFPIFYHAKPDGTTLRWGDISELLGHFIVADFDNMPEWPSNATRRNRDANDTYINSLLDNNDVTISSCDASNEPFEQYVKRPGRYIIVNDNLVFHSERNISDDKITTVSYIDIDQKTTSTIYEEVDAKNSEVAVILTPFNMIIAKKKSPTRISCTTIPYPFKMNKVSTLQEIALAKTYMNFDEKSIFAHTFSI